MKVFISWSRPRSKAVAELLRTWLPRVIQSTRPWMSSHDIPQGKLWRNELFPQLGSSTFAIVCLTHENHENPWLLFEAGAIASHLLMSQAEKAQEEKSRVYTYLLGVDNSDVNPPLGDFQHTKADLQSTRKLFREINELQDEPLKDTDFEPLFDFAWQHMEPKIKEIVAMPAASDVAAPPGRTDREILDEILDRVRQLDRSTQHGPLANVIEGLMTPSPIFTAAKWAKPATDESLKERAHEIWTLMKEIEREKAATSEDIVDG